MKSGKETLGQQAIIKLETTMTSPNLERAQKWSLALRKLMAGPGHMHPFHTITWCFSSPRVGEDIDAIARIAADTGRDIVHVACALDADEPLNVSLVTWQMMGATWLPGVRLYAADEHARVELIANNKRWFVGARRCLNSLDLPLEADLVQGEAIAWRRWREMVSKMETPSRDNMLWVPRGGTAEDAIPYDWIEVTA